MKFDLKEILSKIKLGTTRTPTGYEGAIYLYRDWMWLMVTMLTLSVVMLAVGCYMFYQVSYVSESQNQDAQASVQTLSRTKLQDVINTYVAKETKFNGLKNSKPTVPNL
jgi:hypothetical protein